MQADKIQTHFLIRICLSSPGCRSLWTTLYCPGNLRLKAPTVLGLGLIPLVAVFQCICLDQGSRPDSWALRKQLSVSSSQIKSGLQPPLLYFVYNCKAPLISVCPNVIYVQTLCFNGKETMTPFDHSF